MQKSFGLPKKKKKEKKNCWVDLTSLYSMTLKVQYVKIKSFFCDGGSNESEEHGSVGFSF